MLPFHPGAAKLMSDEFHATLGARLASVAHKVGGNTNATVLYCRVLCNMFSRRALAVALLARMNELIEPLSACVSSADDGVRKAWACLALNFACTFLNSQPPAGGSFEEQKLTLLTAALELLSHEQNTPETTYRALQLVGTLVYRDSACQSIAESLDVAATIDAACARHATEEPVRVAGGEVKQHVLTGK